ncbi:MAG: 6-bladed beta-propeller [bacterium]
MMKNFISIGLILLLFGCIERTNKKHADNVNKKVLEAEYSIDRLSDSTFLGDVTSIYKYKEGIIMVDSKRRSIISLSDEFELRNIFGQKGRGPGDFLNIRNLYLYGDTIIVPDVGKKQMQYYDINGKFLGSIRLDNSITPDLRFCINENGNYYISKTYSKAPIMKYNKSGEFISSFGNKISNLKSSFEITSPDYCYLFIYRNHYLLAISRNRPIIALFDLETEKLINYLNLSENPLFKERILFNAPLIKNGPNGHYNFFSDAFLDKDKLFLSYYSTNKRGAECSNILELDIKKDSISMVQNFELKEKVWIGAMCISMNHLYIYDGLHAQLIKYQL